MIKEKYRSMPKLKPLKSKKQKPVDLKNHDAEGTKYIPQESDDGSVTRKPFDSESDNQISREGSYER